MIDFQVAFDKLAQFETSDEIAGYLASENIQAFRCDSKSCAISRFMKNLTGNEIDTTPRGVYMNTPRCVCEDGEIRNDYEKAEASALCTGAMIKFIDNFDEGYYPNLVDSDDPYGTRFSSPCPCSACV